MSGAVATRSGPRTAGGNTTQTQTTGWKREKKKRKQPKKAELPPRPDLKTYQPAPLCTSFTRGRPALYTFHQVEQQVAQYAAEILVQQRQQHLDFPKKKKLPPQLDKNQQKPQASRGPQQKRRGQRQQPPPPEAELEQYIQRQIQILFDQHGNVVQQQRARAAAASGGIAVAAPSGEGPASTLSQVQGINSKAVKATFDSSLTWPTGRNSWDTSTGTRSPNDATWEGTTHPGNSKSAEASAFPKTTKAAAWRKEEEVNGAGLQQQHQEHQSPVEREGIPRQQENLAQGADTTSSSAAGNYGTSSSGAYPSENFVMVVRRRPRDLKLVAATEGAAAAPGRADTASKGTVPFRRGQKATARTFQRDNKRLGRAFSPPRSKKTTSARSSPRRAPPVAASIGSRISSVVYPDAKEMQATFITHDERFVEMKNALSRYWKSMGRELLVDNLLNKDLPHDASPSVKAAGRTTLQAIPRATTAATGEGTHALQALQQRYFKVKIPRSHHTRVEARWVRKQVSNADGLEESLTVTAGNSRNINGGKAEVAANEAGVRFSESAWSCLTGLEGTVAAAETAQAITAAVSAKLEAPARELQRQRAHTFFDHLAACLRELLSSRDIFFRLAYLDSVYRWFCTRHPRVNRKTLYRSRQSSDVALLPPFPSSNIASAAPFVATTSSSLKSAAITIPSKTSSVGASGLNSSSPIGDPRAVDTARVTRASALAVGSDPPFYDELDRFLEQGRLHTHGFPLLKEAAAFDARELSTCNGSAFLGCTYNRTEEKCYTPCEINSPGTAGRFQSSGSTDSTDHTGEDAPLDNSSSDRLWKRGTVAFDREDRSSTVAREDSHNGRWCPVSDRSCRTAGDVFPLKQRESLGTAAAFAPHAEWSDADERLRAVASAESITAPIEKTFLEIVQQHAPLITPMDRLREYETRSLLKPAAAAAVHQRLQARLRPRLEIAENHGCSFGRVAAALPTSVPSTAPKPGSSQLGARPGTSQPADMKSSSFATTTTALASASATAFAPASATAAFSAASPTAGVERNFSPRSTAANLQPSAVIPWHQQRPGTSSGQHQQSYCQQQQQQLYPPASTQHVQMQSSTFQVATGQAETLRRTDSVEKALLIRDDLRNDYMGDWRVDQQPWGMQAGELPETAFAATSGAEKRANNATAQLPRSRTSLAVSVEGKEDCKEIPDEGKGGWIFFVVPSIGFKHRPDVSRDRASGQYK